MNRLIPALGRNGLRWLLAAGVGLATLAVVSGARRGDGDPEPSSRIDPSVLVRHLKSSAVDLTHTFDERTIYWPLDKSFQWEKTRWGPTEHGWYASATYAASEHGGTHLDSPIHFAENQRTTDEIPVQDLIAPAVVVDVSDACEDDRTYQASAADLKTWEAEHGRIPDGAVVLFRTGWGRYWPDKPAYLGTDRPRDVANLRFPGIGPDAAAWLVEERDIVGVGIDTASLDHGPSKDFRAHRILCEAGLYGLENVARLDELPPTGATLIALPMKIGGGSGGPARIVAILP